MPDTALIVLAAGQSSRMGSPKQLKLLGEKKLIEHAVESGLSSQCRKILVVLGCKQEMIRTHLNAITDKAGRRLELISNQNWQSGMASSIVAAIEFLSRTENSYIKAAIISSCDQPYFRAEKINKMIELYKSSDQTRIIASNYEGINGIPALFPRVFFGQLQQLKGEKGARPIIEAQKARLIQMDFPEAAFDIDTEAELKNYLEKSKQLL